MTESFITMLANIALTLSLIVAVIFGIAQVRTAARDRYERLTLETLRIFQSREFAETILYVNNHELPANGAAMRDLPGDEQALLIQFGQQMESLGMLVAEQLISLDLVDKTLGSFVVAAWEKYKPMFTDLRVNPDAPDPYLGEYFQWLAERINERMTLHPRRPYYEVNRGSK